MFHGLIFKDSYKINIYCSLKYHEQIRKLFWNFNKLKNHVYLYDIFNCKIKLYIYIYI